MYMPALIAALVFFGFVVSALGVVLLIRARDEQTADPGENRIR